MPEPLSLEEAKGLIALCRAGKLYEVEAWIASGKSIQIPPAIKKGPLQIALETGFHSLIVLLLRNETDQAAKNSALRSAVSKRDLELVQLMVAHGAEIRSIEFADILLSWEPTIIRYFLENGADVNHRRSVRHRIP